MTERKWANELKSWLNGADLEYVNHYGETKTFDGKYGSPNPISNPELTWRVKPEQIEGWVNVYLCGDGVYRLGALSPTKQEPERAGTKRVACIPIYYFKGEGL